MNLSIPSSHHSKRRKYLALWLSRALISIVFISAGVVTLWAPIAYLAAHLFWTRQFSPDFVRLIGALNLLGGLGIVLPLRGRISSIFTLAVALSCAALQACSVLLHLQRSEPQFLLLNVLLLALSLFVARTLWRMRD